MAKSWKCDGVPKNNESYPNSSGPHPEQENFGDTCIVCGLPKEAMELRGTVIIGPRPNKPNWVIPLAIAALAVVIGGIGWFLFKPKPTPVVEKPPESTTPEQPITTVDPNVTKLISTGDSILLDETPEKTSGAEAFAQQNWTEAIAKYQEAVNSNPNDPESQIYLNNAKARQQGNPITIAAVVPISSSPDSAKEILRGIAQYQSEYNQNQSNRPLEIIVVDQNSGDRSIASPLAQAIVDNPEVLAVIGYGADLSSKLAMQTYESSQLTVLSPVNTQVEGSNLKLISLNQTEDKLVEDYLQSVAKTLLGYAQKEKDTPKVIIFYNSNSDYSNNLKQAIVDVLPEFKGELVEAIDIDSPDYDPNQNLSQGNTIILALSKDRVTEAIAIAEKNNNQLLLMGGDEMYNPDILVQGQNKIDGLILAVPWSAKSGDTFAQEAVKLWKGKVSWRTKTAYDATKILTDVIEQSPNRHDVYQSLQQGVTLEDGTIDLSIFGEVPLVKATPGAGGPPGSTHGFTAIE